MKQKASEIRKSVNSTKGFTLVELIIAMAIMSILLGMYYSLFFAGGRTYEHVYDSYKTQNEARIAMSFITVKIRQNDCMITDTQHAIQVEQEPAPDSRWYMKVTDESGTEEFIYTLPEGSGKRLMVSQTAAFDPDGAVVAENLYDVTFSSNTIEENTCIDIAVAYNEGGMDKLEESVVLRAK